MSDRRFIKQSRVKKFCKNKAFSDQYIVLAPTMFSIVPKTFSVVSHILFVVSKYMYFHSETVYISLCLMSSHTFCTSRLSLVLAFGGN